MRLNSYLFIWAFISSFSSNVSGNEHDHKYNEGDDVIVWVNIVGPEANNQETYSYFDLPYCKGKAQFTDYHENIGEALLGYKYEHSGIPIKFKTDVGNETLCEVKNLTEKQIQQFKNAVEEDYWYDMIVDGLIARVPVGKDDDFLLYSHREFEIKYNEDSIVGLKIIPSSLIQFNNTDPIKFTYSVKFIEAKDIAFKDRLVQHVNSEGEHKVRWLAVGNSFLIVLFLIGLVSVILMRTLRKDFARYGKSEDETELGINGLDIIDDYGWKQIHGDVFRPPKRLMLLASLLGTGTQLLGVTLTVILFTIIGDLSFDRTKILSIGIFLYATLAISSGYVAIRFYTGYEGKNWTRCALLCASLFPFAVGITSSVINTIAITWHSTRAVPFLTILALFSTWLFLAVPLTLLGGILGKRSGLTSHLPCRVNALPRPIPVKPWYFEPLILILGAGVLPFGSLFIELYYVFRSFWTYQPYYLYGFFLLSFILLAIVTSCCGLVATYIHINNEDHRWHWLSFFSGASTSLYIYVYAIYYFHVKTKMYGAFQTGFYFGNLLLTCIALSCTLGTISYYTSSLFVKKIFSTVKID